MSFTIKNGSGATSDLVIESVTIDSDAIFNITDEPASGSRLTAGDSLNFKINFHP